MFESHPIPQQISSYQFRLVGDMTLKQFFQLAGGALVALLFYATGLHPIIKWPLMLTAFATGAALAFSPFEERPLSQWMLAFFRSIYSPTIFVWKKTTQEINYFQTEESTIPDEKVITPQGPAVANQYLNTLPQSKTAPIANLDNEEKSVLDKMTGILNSLLPKKDTIKETPPSQPQPEVKNTVSLPVATEIKETFTEKPIETAPSPKPDVQIPANIPVSIPKTEINFQPTENLRPKITVVEEIPATAQTIFEASSTPVPSPITQTIAPTFSDQAAPPNLPTIPNTISGQVVDPEGKIVEGAILEIRDIAGRPVRALRSNKLGHFIVVTALPNGDYTLITEKEGFVFDNTSFTTNGSIIPPILIKASQKIGNKEVPYSGPPLKINR